MSTLSEHTGNGNPPATRLQREDTKEHIDGVLQHFDVLPTRFDRFLFKYIYVYLIGLFLPLQLLLILYNLLSIRSQLVRLYLQEGVLAASPVVGIILIVWFFNIWRWRTPKRLRDLWENKRIATSDGDADTSYLRFLEHYCDALASPKRYFLSGFLIIIFGIITAFGIVTTLAFERPNSGVTILVVGYVLNAFLYWGVLYCFGILTWIVFISGWNVRNLARAFEFRIVPFHPDQCGGLKPLGNFCFGLVSPLLIASGLLIGYILFSLLAYSPAIYGSENSAVYLALNVGFPLLILLLYNLPVMVLAFMLPLLDIHTKMVSEGETNENIYVAHIEALREEIQSLLNSNQVEEAKAVQEKKVLEETLYTPYPTWPFQVRSKIFSTVLTVSGSLLIAVMTAALQRYILMLLFHTP